VVAKEIAYQPYIDAAEKYYGINRVELKILGTLSSNYSGH
jgi:hypothetical protein